MNLQLWTMVSLENSIIQIISFHITWFIYKKTNKEHISLLESILFKSLRYSGITW